jgi:cell division protein FtsW
VQNGTPRGVEVVAGSIRCNDVNFTERPRGRHATISEAFMARTLKSDRWLFGLTLLLVAVSVVMVYSASAVRAADDGDGSYHYLLRQGSWALIGFVAMWAAMRTDYRHYRRPVVIWGLFGVTLTLLVAVFSFAPINGTQRWISLGVASLQPSEIAKLSVILFAAALLDRRMHRINEVRQVLLPIALVTLLFVGLILRQPDYGTSAVILAVAVVMVFLAGLQYRYVFAAGLLLAPAAGLLAVSTDYRFRRIMAFLDPEADPYGAGYQANQSLIALGSGGVSGLGFMDGIQKRYYLPEAHTDFIYAVIGEEFGLIGTTLVLLCFAAVAWRGLRIGLLAPDRFGALLGLGITTVIVLQALVNMSVVTALAPTKGIPLPFVSMGGSSLLINMIGMGVLLNISQHVSAVAGPAGQPKAGWMLESQEA